MLAELVALYVEGHRSAAADAVRVGVRLAAQRRVRPGQGVGRGPRRLGDRPVQPRGRRPGPPAAARRPRLDERRCSRSGFADYCASGSGARSSRCPGRRSCDRRSPTFDPQEPLGDGRTVIEASAGTGKTFTISALVTRLIAEEGVAARRDPRRHLHPGRHRRAALPGPHAPRRHAAGPRRQAAPTRAGRASRRAARRSPRPTGRRCRRPGSSEALTHFDRAQIFTIHGFAQRLLGQLGLRARLSPELEPGEPDELLLRADRQRPHRRPLRHRRRRGAAEVERRRSTSAAPWSAPPTPASSPTPTRSPARPGPGSSWPTRCATEVRRRMRAGGLVTYDDGLVEVRDTLADPEVGAAARELLARRYSVALVDESQDTDPIQWQVIRAVFDESRLVVIGDPKQSIYSFRGADVESYLAALDGADALRTLATNWRSDGPLHRRPRCAVRRRHLRRRPHRVPPGPARPRPRSSPHPRHRRPPLAIRRFGADLKIPTRRDGFFLRRPRPPGRRRRRGVRRSCGCSPRASTIDGADGPEPLRPDQIAVLCRTRKQVDMVRAELTRRSVPSVAARTGGVFASDGRRGVAPLPPRRREPGAARPWCGSPPVRC